MGEKANRGVIFFAKGSRHVNSVIKAAKSIKDFNDLKIHVFSDKEVRSEYIDSYEIIDISKKLKSNKIQSLSQTPFDQTIYLDTDIRVVNPIDELFSLLGKYDLAVCHAHNRVSTHNKFNYNQAIPYSFPQLNTGVIVFNRNKQTQTLFDKWEKEFEERNVNKDQVPFRELLWELDINFFVLPPEYNIRHKRKFLTWHKKEITPKILHHYKYTHSMVTFNSIKMITRSVMNNLNISRFLKYYFK